jgi:hypothetical protein
MSVFQSLFGRRGVNASRTDRRGGASRGRLPKNCISIESLEARQFLTANVGLPRTVLLGPVGQAATPPASVSSAPASPEILLAASGKLRITIRPPTSSQPAPQPALPPVQPVAPQPPSLRVIVQALMG